MKKEIYTVSELAAKVGRTRASIYQLIYLGKLKAKRDIYKDTIYVEFEEWENFTKPHLVDYQSRKHSK